MDAGGCDPKGQVKAVAAELKAMNATRLFEVLEAMSTSLVMGVEDYLRKFDSEVAIPLLANVCETFMKASAQGDLLVISLRALSLIMEHVPSSYDAAQRFHVTLMQLASKAIDRALRTKWRFAQFNNSFMIEEGLRVIRFICKDDMTGQLIHHAFVGDLLALCTDPHSLIARQALETLLTMSSKVIMPSELLKPTHSFAAGILAFFKFQKKSSHTDGVAGKAGRTSDSRGRSSAKATAAEDIVPHMDHPTVVQVENVIVPLLVSLIEQYAKSFGSIPEHWALLELSLQCLGTLIDRALICHRSHTARALASPVLPKILFQLIVDTESNVTLEPSVRVERVLLCETTLAALTRCHRWLMMESLLLPEAQRFFRLILEVSSEEITTLLDDPFPRAVIATRSTQRRDKDHITSIAALQLFVLACPTVPPDAFGLKPKLVLPVHQWMWEDELRHNNRLVEEQCVCLETSWTRLDHRARISVHLKQLDADLRSMTISRGTRGGHRNISRAYVPFVFHFADEVALRPIVAVKDAGPCAVDGTSLVSKPTASGMLESHVTDSATVVNEMDSHMSGSSSTRRCHHKGSSMLRALSDCDPTCASSTVVMNTKLEVPAKHIALAEEYFISLCVFAKNTSGQMAKQVATSACASMLQLMFLSGASERFEGLMKKAVPPMCEMCREALISADKATKAVVLTMIEWMLYHPMAESCDFVENTLRCGLLDQLELLSKATVVVHDKPTRTSTLAEKASALAASIVKKLKRQRAAQVGSTSVNANVSSSTALDTVLFSSTMLRLQSVLEELKNCQCGAINDTAAATNSAVRAGKARADTHESAIRELLRIFDESNYITAYEVFKVGVGSTLLYYLLGDWTPEGVVGNTGANPSRASSATLLGEHVEQRQVHPAPIDQNVSLWAALMANGKHVADVLTMYVVEKRMRCFIECAAAYPAGMRRLVYILTANLSLQSDLPLVESVVTNDKVVCKTPLQAHQALSAMAPMIALCGHAGRRLTTAIKTTTGGGVSLKPAASSTNSEGSRAHKTSFMPFSLSRSGTDSLLANNPAAVSGIANECCMAGHRLHYMEGYPQICKCDQCRRSVFSGHYCCTCNYNVCGNCYSGYTGNVQLFKSAAAMERNHVHPCATIGDLERWFRTGSTSTKGADLAPTSQSSLHHLEWFTTRVLIFLKRYSAFSDTSGLSSTSHTSRVAASNSPYSTNPTANINLLVGLAERLLKHPNVVRRLTYKYLSQFSLRGELMDEGTPITPASAAALDAEVQAVLSTPEERRTAEQVVQEAVEERYILYRPSCGTLPFQETLLSTLYRRAFALGDHQVLLQLENCLLRADSTAEEPLTLSTNSSVTVANPAAMPNQHSANLSVTKKSKPAKSPPAAVGKPATTSVERSLEACEFEGHQITTDQTYLFHHFESDAASHCACGAHSRAEFHTEEPPALTFTAPGFAHRADMLLLIMLHRVLFEETHQGLAYAAEAKSIFGSDDSIFVNYTITTALVRSLEASALRVSILPLSYALPRWVNFLLREGRFLIPRSVRERVSRFLAYGARRAFMQHMRAFRNQRNDRAGLILPGEWAKLSNHKFSVSRETFARDAYTMLRKCSDARFPISVEFNGDVGVGQGPTAQFYTLLAAEASKYCAKLWRVSDHQNNGGGNAASTQLKLPSQTVRAHHPVAITSSPLLLPVRRSSVKPASSATRGCTSQPDSFTNRRGSSVISQGPSTAPTTSSSRTLVRVGSVQMVPPMAALSLSGSMAASPEVERVQVPPPEGFYPRHMAGVRRYPEDGVSCPATPQLRLNHNHTLREDGVAQTSNRSGGSHIASPASRKSLFSSELATNVGNNGSHHTRNSVQASAAQSDMNRAAFLVDSNVGLMRDYVLEQRERIKIYYAIGAALGRAFLDEQVFPLPLSPAVAYFIRRGLPAFQCAVPDATGIDPPPAFPIDLFELPLTAASWVDQGIAHSLASLSTMDSATLAALDLPFTLPGDDSFELFPGGAQMTVSRKSLRLYQRRVVGALLYESVAVPLYFLTMGCRDVVPPEALSVMEVKELIDVLCGECKSPNEPLWTTSEIRSVLVGDHGYQNDSPQLELLAKVLGDRLTPAEQRDFLLFCTGCPRLPIGGIRALGAITVVKRSNAFVVAHAQALQAGLSAATASRNSGAEAIDIMGEEEDDVTPPSRLYRPMAPSDAQDNLFGGRETSRRGLTSLGCSASEELCGTTSSFALELPESEWALPSVNTCFRYLKLPPYPNEDLLYKKLMMSIKESGGSFELS
ncbi:hypothetical protein JKF63_01242 [Porcisia hertigi]|uniref:HECT domain-containing protein n=1 Tax=Porcisia hertigi TaxID=2761500 RepID=A0A836I3C1_9TRYP|nr:hypothetical protein JKF63_01242 [Porcisia hertigi]